MDNRKNNTGQPKKAAGQRKRPVTIYEIADDIELVGGLEVARNLLKAAFLSAVAGYKRHLEQTNYINEAAEAAKPGL